MTIMMIFGGGNGGIFPVDMVVFPTTLCRSRRRRFAGLPVSRPSGSKNGLICSLFAHSHNSKNSLQLAAMVDARSHAMTTAAMTMKRWTDRQQNVGQACPAVVSAEMR